MLGPHTREFLHAHPAVGIAVLAILAVFVVVVWIRERRELRRWRDKSR